MSNADEDKSAEERRARLRALREKRGETVQSDDGEGPAAPGEGEKRGRLMKAIAKKRGLKGGAGAAGGGGRRRAGAGRRGGAGGGGAGGGRGAGLGRAGGGGARRRQAADGDGEQFPKLRQILARRRAQGGGGDADVAPEQQIGALKKRLQRLSDAVERTEAELAAARENVGGDVGSRAAKAKIRKKAVAKKVAAKARARRKDND